MPRIKNAELRKEMQLRAYTMNLRGATQRDIGAELGVSAPTAKVLINEYIDNLYVPEADKARAAELDRLAGLDAIAYLILDEKHIQVQHGHAVMLDGHTLKETGPVFKALDSIRKNSEARRKLLGLDKPSESVHTVRTENAFDETYRGLVEEVEARNREEAARLSDGILD
ncbi:hypothetical protein ACFUN8_18505 [Streptomyces sp. NPDC057307]|uniref:hypothetical protein n=1 Tax=Streptomyces sp. NPDC057307 TaxID=3346096 RepID=UPI003629B177